MLSRPEAVSKHVMIRQVTTESELECSARVIRESFATVASDLALTPDNCPTHPAFTTPDKLAQMAEKGIKLFALYDDPTQIGFIAIEKASDEVYYIERLAVLPEHRHAGLGRQLMDFAFDYVRAAGGKTVSIGIIDENRTLKRWYES